MAWDQTRLRELLEPGAEALGYELVDIEYLARGAASVLRLYIDAPGGITADDCEMVSRQASAVLDVEDPIPGQYALEVSSPGLDRPLVKPEHYRHVVGQRVRLLLGTHVLGRRRFRGALRSVSADGVVIEVDGEAYEIAYQDIVSGRLAPEILMGTGRGHKGGKPELSRSYKYDE